MRSLLVVVGQLMSLLTAIEGVHQHALSIAAGLDCTAPVEFIPRSKSFRLTTLQSSWIFRVHPETGQLQHLYWGSKIPNEDDLSYLDAENEVVSFDAGVKNGILQEFPEDNAGDYRIPAFRLRFADDGYAVSNLVYNSHKIMRGPEHSVYSDWQPHVRTGADDWSVLVELVDPRKNLRVQLLYTVFVEFDVITRAVRFINNGSETVVLEEVNSCSVDFPAASHQQPYHMTQLSGSWGRERQLQTRRISAGLQGFESRRGASSHQHNPFIVLSKG